MAGDSRFTLGTMPVPAFTDSIITLPNSASNSDDNNESAPESGSEPESESEPVTEERDSKETLNVVPFENHSEKPAFRRLFLMFSAVRAAVFSTENSEKRNKIAEADCER